MIITIYELLGMIKDGKAPKKIMYDGKIYEYQGDDYLYKDKDKHEYWLFSESYTDKREWLDDFLNDEVEILETTITYKKNNKIEKIIVKDNKIQAKSTGTYCYTLRQIDETIIKKINEIINVINRGD